MLSAPLGGIFSSSIGFLARANTIEARSSFELEKSVNKFLDRLQQILHTIIHYWIDSAKYFCTNSSNLSTIYDRFKLKGLKVVESKNRHYFY